MQNIFANTSSRTEKCSQDSAGLGGGLKNILKSQEKRENLKHTTGTRSWGVVSRAGGEKCFNWVIFQTSHPHPHITRVNWNCLQRGNIFENYVKLFFPERAPAVAGCGSPPPSGKYLFCLGPCEAESDGRNKCLRNLRICLNGNSKVFHSFTRHLTVSLNIKVIEVLKETTRRCSQPETVMTVCGSVGLITVYRQHCLSTLMCLSKLSE